MASRRGKLRLVRSANSSPMRKRRPAKIHRGDRRRSAGRVGRRMRVGSLARREGRARRLGRHRFRAAAPAPKTPQSPSRSSPARQRAGRHAGRPAPRRRQLGLKARLHVGIEGSDEGRSVRDSVRTDIRRAGGDRSSGGLTRTLPSLPPASPISRKADASAPPCWDDHFPLMHRGDHIARPPEL